MATTSSTGTCRRCGAKASRAAMLRHLAACWAEAEEPGDQHDLLHLRIEAAGDKAHWLDIEVRTDAHLADLDTFLRRIWLECCGHWSGFRFPRPRAASGWDDHFDDCDAVMRQSLAQAVAGVRRFNYEYDPGSPTLLDLRNVGRRDGPLPAATRIRVLARNDPPVWSCVECGRPASAVCAECEAAPYCARHAGRHGCDADMQMPIVDSPRTGVCGYVGPSVEPGPRPRRGSSAGGPGRRRSPP